MKNKAQQMTFRRYKEFYSRVFAFDSLRTILIYSFKLWEYKLVFIFVAALKYTCTLNDRNSVCMYMCRE